MRHFFLTLATLFLTSQLFASDPPNVPPHPQSDPGYQVQKELEIAKEKPLAEQFQFKCANPAEIQVKANTPTISGICSWGRKNVSFNYTGLTPRGKLTRASIDRIIRECKRQIEAACGIKLTLIRQGGGGDIITVWGSRSAHWRPCDEQPAHGWIAANTASLDPVTNAEYVFKFNIMHEVLGHGLGLDHQNDMSLPPTYMDVSGRPGSGLQDPSHPIVVGEWVRRQLVARYGRPPPQPLPNGFYVVHQRDIIKPIVPRRRIARIKNGKYAARPNGVGPGLYWASPNASNGVVPVWVSQQPKTYWRLKATGIPVVVAHTDFNKWFGPINKPAGNSPFVLAPSGRIKPGTVAVNRITFPPISNAQFTPRGNIGIGLYFANPRGEDGVVPVWINNTGTFRLKNRGEPVMVDKVRFRRWFGPIRPPID